MSRARNVLLSFAIETGLMMGCVVGALLLATPVQAATYYVGPSGVDTASCASAQNIGTPKATITNAVTCLAAGDTLYIRGGTYAEFLQWFGWRGGTQGTSWETAINIKAYSGEPVIVRPPVGSQQLVVMRGSASGATDAPRYIVFDGITFDGANVYGNEGFYITAWDNRTGDAAAHHIRLTNSRITNLAHAQGLLVTWGSNDVQLDKVEIDNIGGPTTIPNNTQCVYGAAHNMVIQNSWIHHCWGYGISNINSNPGLNVSNHVIRNNSVHDTGLGRTGLGGINLGEGTGHLIYNNFVYNTWGPGIALAWGDGSTDTAVYNNTIYNNSGVGIYIGSAQTRADVRNNVSYLNRGGNYSDLASSTTNADNSMDGTNPQFRQASSGDFRLESTSPLIDAAAALSVVTTDFTGLPRPQGARYDIGAIEQPAAAGTPPAPTGVRLLR